MTSFDVFSDSVLDVTTQEFHQGALRMVVREWMRRILARLRAEYQEKNLEQKQHWEMSCPSTGREGHGCRWSTDGHG